MTTNKKKKEFIFLFLILVLISGLVIYLLQKNTNITGFVVEHTIKNTIKESLIDKNKTSNIQEQLVKLKKEIFVQEVEEKNALESLAKAKAIKEELELVSLKTNYVNDQLIEAQKAYDGQNVSMLVDQIFSIKNETEREFFTSSLKTTFTPEEIDQLLNHAEKIRYNYS